MDRWVPYNVHVPRWSKRCCLLIAFLVLFFLIFGPSYYRHFFWQEIEIKEPPCDVNPSILDLYPEVDIYNARVDGYPEITNSRRFALFVGNGYFGVPLNGDFSFYVKSARTLSQHVPYYPAVRIKIPVEYYIEQTALHYTHGVAIVDHCYQNKVRVSYTYFAHRTIPSVFVQEIRIKNAFAKPLVFNVEQKGHQLWDSVTTRNIKLYNADKHNEEDFVVITGKVLDSTTDYVLIVSVVMQKIPSSIPIPALKNDRLVVYSSVSYMRLKRDQFNAFIAENENKAISDLKIALGKSYETFKQDHINVWMQLWNTGFAISDSKATGALNGDLINATIYYVLSSVPALFDEETTSVETKTFVTNSLSYVEGCYGSDHHTLEAENLWGNMETIEDINNIVSLWLLTLEKQGCQNLVKAGAEGVMQAMVLSFGSFRFKGQHLELNMHPQFLHRTYHFRRINYGNQTHVNVTVEIDENDKALLFIALDRSDKNYYACDGGCLDAPVQLGPETVQFSVKLTKPFTAILYITADLKHMKELKHTLHVKEVAEAPAQERNMIIMHKHGHHLGGLPTFFWISIFTLIVIFHLFLLKLIYNEYWNQDKYKPRQQDGRYRSNLKYRLLH